MLGVAAHPDDLDVIAGGSVAVWAAAGVEVHYLVCSDGSKGSDDPKASRAELTQTRRGEQEAAAKVLGVQQVHFLDYEDGTMECTSELKRDICRLIRQLKPDVVVTMDPTFVYSAEHNIINHTDHRAVGQATLDAVYPLARDHLSFPELATEGLEPHKVKSLLLSNFEKADYYQDVSAVFDKKLAALKAHSSQFGDANKISGFVRAQAEAYGKDCGCALAEGFVRIDVMD